MLEVNQLGCLRGEKWLWENLNIELSPGHLLQVSGSNGSGKTSLLRILCGLSPPTRGTLYWKGELVAKQAFSYSQQVNYLSHQPPIKSELSVEENLRFSCYQATTIERRQALERIGLLSYRHCFGYQLSQGQRQRVALARLLLRHAPLWILDEPFSGLDREMIQVTQDLCFDHLRQSGMVILSTHHSFTASSQNIHILSLDQACRD